MYLLPTCAKTSVHARQPLLTKWWPWASAASPVKSRRVLRRTPPAALTRAPCGSVATQTRSKVGVDCLAGAMAEKVSAFELAPLIFLLFWLSGCIPPFNVPIQGVMALAYWTASKPRPSCTRQADNQPGRAPPLSVILPLAPGRLAPRWTANAAPQ